MTKSAVIALFAFTLLPFSGCSSNSDQAAYMSSPNAEQNAREAEQAEEEFALLASKEVEKPKAEKSAEHKVAAQKPEKKTQKKAEHKVVEHKAAQPQPSTPVAMEAREPASAHEAKHAAVHGDRVYTVQLGAFRVKENAAKLTEKLKSAGFPVMMVNKEGSKSGELYLVHLEPTPNKSEAEKWQSDLKMKSFDSTVTLKRD